MERKTAVSLLMFHFLATCSDAQKLLMVVLMRPDGLAGIESG